MASPVPLLIGSYVMGAAVLAAVIVLLLRVGRPRHGHPSCIACGYDLTARAERASACPECGRTLDAGSVIGAGRRRPLSVARRVVLLTCIMLAATLTVTPLLHHYLPQRAHFVQTSSWTSPQSKAFQQLSVTASVTSMRRPLPIAPSASITFLDHDGVTHTFSIDRATATARFLDADGRPHERPLAEADNLTGDAIYDWFTGLGLESNDPAKLRIEADALSAYLHQQDSFLRVLPGTGAVPETVVEVWPGMPFMSNTKSISQTAAPEPLRIPMLVLPWVVLWAIGLLLLLWPRRATAPVIAE